MHYPTNPLAPWRQMLSWAILPVLILSLMLAAACGDDEPTAAPAEPTSPAQIAVPQSGDTGDSEAATQARTAAAAAQAAAEAALTAAEAAQVVAEGARQGEDRPAVTVIGSGSASVSASASGSGTGSGSGSVSGAGTGSGSGSVSGTASASVSGTGTGSGSVSGPAAAAAVTTVIVPVEGHGGTGGLLIPAGLNAETSGPTVSDGIYTPTTNREIYQKISSDYQEIVALTNLVNLGRPLPAAEIMLLYEVGMHSRIGPNSRTLRGFARDPRRAEEYPDSAAYYESTTFLDSPISNAIRQRGEAEEYTPAQRQQAIQKGVLRIVYHWAKRYMFLGIERMSSRLVDEAWAVYVGEQVNGEYPNSVAATALKLEGNFGREGTIDVPLRGAMDRARQAADDMDEAAINTAAQEVYSRFNAVFYLGTVKYLNEAFQRAEANNAYGAGIAQVEGLGYYRSIQPEVAKASTAADETIVAYFQAAPDQLTVSSRDAALAALNNTASELLLERSDLVTRLDADTGTGPSGGFPATGRFLIPVGLVAETEGPTKADGYYTGTTNREIYQKISTDYQEIAKLTNLINEGKPLPAAEILLLYEAGMHTRIGPNSRTLRGFARDPRQSIDFADSVAFYESATFLDSPVSNAIRQRGEAEEYSDAQRRQAINKSLLRIIYHWSKRYMFLGREFMSSRLVDEAWAVYVGEEVNGEYPNSLAATARKREADFGREGTIDVPLREAMDRARQAADDADWDAYDAAAQEVYSRFNAIFYLATVRYIGRAADDAQAGDHDSLGTHQVEALSFYRSIQPDVGIANAASDETIVAYLTAEPSEITTASRDAALAALNRASTALLLTRDDLVTSYE